jgi:hypothetical protein
MAFYPADKAHFLELWDKIFPGAYTEPIQHEGQGEGYDIPSMMAEVWAAVARATNDAQQAYFLRRSSIATGDVSSGARFATGVLKAVYAAPIRGPIPIFAGQVVVAWSSSTDGTDADLARYRVAANVVLEGPETMIPIVAEMPGSDWNITAPPDELIPGHPLLPGPTPWARWRFEGAGAEQLVVSVLTLSALLEVLPLGTLFHFSSVDTFEDGVPRVVTSSTDAGSLFSPPLLVSVTGSVTIEVSNSATDFGVTLQQEGAVSGGAPATLDAIGSDVGVGREPGEDDEDFRRRLGEFPDIVSPAALECIIGQILDPCGIPWRFLEGCPQGANVNTTDACVIGFTYDVQP